ncbi:hypothetical protein RHMOL_Rhmol06G0204500 [Rhododendron molle]|uniref:Uncharacterized protein n=1 Tax=Rhododendron molle TaxID=49168 RepID=A0ACC0NFJ7_RHOML|nr:hypothetical protein RHMOL_Rhmol06G0204500 [Rhododendron molle]
MPLRRQRSAAPATRAAFTHRSSTTTFFDDEIRFTSYLIFSSLVIIFFFFFIISELDPTSIVRILVGRWRKPERRWGEQEKGRPLPKFGEWDANNPASADGFTVIFNKARDEKRTTGTAGTIVAPQRNDNHVYKQTETYHQQYPPKITNHSATIPALVALDPRFSMMTVLRLSSSACAQSPAWACALAPRYLLPTRPDKRQLECDIEEVKDVIDQVKGSWKKELLTKVVTQEEMQEILSVPISQVNRKDHLVWHYTKNGSYSVKSGYHQAVLASTTQGNGPSSSFTPNKKLWEVVWKLNIPHKVRHFWWRACSNSLATKENLMRRRCGSSKVCPICESFEESIEHILFDCQWVRAVWFGCNLNLNVGHGHPRSVQKWTSQIVDDLKGEQLMGYLEKIVMIAWHIWKSRNDFVFNYIPVDPERTLRKAFAAIHEFSDLRIPSLVHTDNLTVEDVSSQWKAPGHGSVKLNCDVAVHRNGRDGVLRNSEGELVNGQVINAKINSPLHGELVAIRLACGMVKSLGIRRAIVESDNQMAIKLSVSELVPPWDVAAVVLDIRQLCEEEEIKCAWIKRSANGLAHSVAGQALKGLLLVNWVVSPSVAILSSVTRDIFPLL